MKRGVLYCFSCRGRFEPGEGGCPRCAAGDALRSERPLLVVRPSFPARWFLAAVATRFAGLLGVLACFAVAFWGFGPGALEVPGRVLLGAPLALVAAFLVPGAVRWFAARRAEQHCEFRFLRDRLDYATGAGAREERSLALVEIRAVRCQRTAFLPGRGRVLLEVGEAAPGGRLVMECVPEPERVAEQVRALVASARSREAAHASSRGVRP